MMLLDFSFKKKTAINIFTTLKRGKKAQYHCRVKKLRNHEIKTLVFLEFVFVSLGAEPSNGLKVKEAYHLT